MRTTYEQVSRRAVKTLPCVTCGKPQRRQHTFTETLNPWNTNDDGTVKTRREIYDSLDAKAKAWQQVAGCCTACNSAVRP